MAGPPDSILTQLNIRNNVREMHDSMKDLASWEKDMRNKEAAALKKKGVSNARNAPAVRGKAPAVQPASDPQLQQPAAQLLPGAPAAAVGAHSHSQFDVRRQ